ncbi:MAG: phosphatase PAP2 family protein [Caldilineaceae bacterium]
MLSSSLLDWGVQVVLWFQHLGAWLRLPMNALTFTGDIEFYLLLLPVLYWTVDRRLGLRVAVLLLLSIVLNSVIKMLLHAPRPYWFDPQVQLWTAPEFSFGIPSGHAQNAVVMWGLFAAYGRRAWGWLVAVILIGLTGLSRLYLGVHFPTDVLAGWLLGVLLLWGALRWGDAVEIGVKARSPLQQFILLFWVSLGLTVAGLLLRMGVQSTWSLPAIWVETALATAGVAPAPFSLENIVTATGSLLGLTAGALLCVLQGGFRVDGQGRAYLLRCLLGIIGILLLWRGLDLLFTLLAPDESVVGYFLRYLRYTAVGLWVAGVAPILFVRLKLATAGSIGV